MVHVPRVTMVPGRGCVAGDLTLVGTVGGKRTLVLLDNFEIKETHSFFFGALAGDYLYRQAASTRAEVPDRAFI